MNAAFLSLVRSGSLLAINLLFVMVWGFTGIGKLVNGMPSWFTLNWRNSFNITQMTKLQFAIENILDRNYRYFASGFSAPGRNYVIALRTSF